MNWTFLNFWIYVILFTGYGRSDKYKVDRHFDQTDTITRDEYYRNNKDSFFGEVGRFVKKEGFPTKSVILAIFLSILGIGLFITGFIEEVNLHKCFYKFWINRFKTLIQQEAYDSGS